MADKMLSIIMITVPDRWERFTKLKSKVQKQIDYCTEVHPTLGLAEIVEVSSPKYQDGGETIGKKRQIGLMASRGEYVCWLDDDDDISPDYVETLLRLCNKGADVCTFNNVSKFDNFWMVVQMSLKTKHDQGAKPGIIDRRPYHVCAWRRLMVLPIEFPNTNWDEDIAFINGALKLAKTEAHTDAILHEYNRTSLVESLSNNNVQVRSIVR